MSEINLTGISIKKTNNGFSINLTGDIYRKIGEKVNNGELTKPFYGELKKFIREITKLA
ncbi:MAG: hypothetical protein HeimC3_52800 [Candidatus Heimdallarchaeota archaeon LC_3]|nr:MAG: hypothetical protein HeimC3_52800 [Candidatus Heimdallarchaeota archaeon LC_3]